MSPSRCRHRRRLARVRLAAHDCAARARPRPCPRSQPARPPLGEPVQEGLKPPQTSARTPTYRARCEAPDLADAEAGRAVHDLTALLQQHSKHPVCSVLLGVWMYNRADARQDSLGKWKQGFYSNCFTYLAYNGDN
jgi:hypothetical protein